MSDNKKILNEQTIRRFMKLADIQPLAEEFISKVSHDEKLEEEVEVTEEQEEVNEEAEQQEVSEEVEEISEEEEIEEMAHPAKKDEEGEEDEMQELLAKGIQAMVDALGLSDMVTIDTEEEGEEMDAPEEEDMLPPPPEAEEEEMGEEEPAARDYMEEGKKSTTIDVEALTNRIMERLAEHSKSKKS